MKNILFLMPAMLNGGAEKVLIDILKHFDYTRYNVSLLLECKEGPYIHDIPDEVELIYLHKKNLWIERLYRYMIMLHCKWLVYQILCRLPLLWRLKGDHFDTIVSFMEGMAVRMHSYIYDKADRNLSWVHIDFKKKHWSLDFFHDELDECNCYQKMDKIVFVSHDARDRFKEIFKIDDHKLEVVYNLIDCKEIKKLADSKIVEKNKFTICMVGRLNQQKRYDRALKVARKLKESGYDLKFWILGDGEQKIMLRDKIKEYGLKDYFILKGFIKPPYPYMKESDILLICSESEGFSLVACEAFCLGVPVVSTKTAGPTELIKMSKAGLLVNENIDDIYMGLKYMIDNKAFRDECSINALDFANTFEIRSKMEKIYSLI